MSQLQWNQISYEIKTALQKIINLINNSGSIYIATTENDYRFLLESELSILLLPKQLFPDVSTNQSLEELPCQDAKMILSHLCDEIDKLERQGNQADILQPILTEILKLSQNNLLEILSNNPTWRCLIASNRQNQIKFYSYNDFKNFKQNLTLFRNHNNSIIELLVQALENIQPVLVENKIATLLKSDQNISPEYCNADICKLILSKTPALSQPANRQQLLNELLKEVN
jgi:hypothetical protein